MTEKFVHLHLHSEFSMLDGASRIGDVVAAAKRDGQPAVGITDHGNMYGVLDLYKEANKQGVKPIIGIELYQAYESRKERFSRRGQHDDTGGETEAGRKQYYHLTALAESNDGYKNLIQLASRAYLEGYYQKPRVDWDLLAEHSKGIIATSGCLGGQVLQALVPDNIMNPDKNRKDPLTQEERFENALQIAGRMQDIFGRDNFFIEIQDHGIRAQQWSNPHLVRIAEKLHAPLLATNDSHYTHRHDAAAHDALLCVQTGALMSETNRFKFEGEEHYIKSAQEMRHLFKEIPSSCDNTLWVAERCNVDIEFGNSRLPAFPLPEGFQNDSNYLEALTMRGAKKRWGDNLSDDIVERLAYELKVIDDMGFSSYFLIVWDLVRHARETNIRVGPGRGSAAGCAVAYCLGITNLDPIKYDLLFERFLNPSRVSMPDIDMDFDSRFRDEMIRYTAEKYGRDHVAQIVTFSTIKARAAVRDAARVLGEPYMVGDKIAKAMPPVVMGRDTPLHACMELDPKHSEGFNAAAELRDMYNNDSSAKQVIDVALGLENLRRQDGIHAAAVVITDEPLTEYLPVQRKPEAGKPIEEAPVVTQYEMHTVEELGLLKMDFLGLRNLDVISDTIKLIERTQDFVLNIDDIPLDDKKTFEMLQKADSIAVFQLESPQMRALMENLAPTEFEDIAALVALYRPGPMAANMHNDYADRKNGRQDVAYLHPDAEEILSETYGLMIYQESVMRIAQKFAGYTLAEADNLRKACLPRGSLMLTRSRGYIPIEQVMSLGDRRVQTIDTRTANTHFDEVADVWSVGRKMVYRVTTSSGYTVEATAEHPLLVEDQWRELRKIRPGDLVAVASRTTTNSYSRISDAEVDLSALLISEGGALDFLNGTEESAHFSHTDPQLLDVFRKAYNEHFSESHHSSYQTGSVTQLHLARDEVLSLKPVLGTLGASEHKTISSSILNAPLHKVERFLGLCFCADGWADKSGVYYGSKSIEIVKGLKRLLLRCGITSNINESKTETLGTNYTLSIADKDQAKAFAAIVEPHLTDIKSEKVNSWLREWGEAPCETTIGIPASFLTEELVRREKIIGCSKKNLDANSGGGPKSNVLRRETLDGLLCSERLEDLRVGDLVWDTVVSIEEVGEEECFDFQMSNPDRPYALVEDVLVHNCGKKIRELIAKERVKFVEGCENLGYGEQLGNDWFDIIEPFADYAFNKSHSYGYGLVAYQTAYLKANYPVEYMAAILTSVKTNLDKAAVYLHDCRVRGIPVSVPDINRSMVDFEPVLKGYREERSDGEIVEQESDEILFGLSAVRNVGEALVEMIVEERKSNGSFVDFYDFCNRVDLQVLNKKTIDSLIKAGSFDSVGHPRRGLLEVAPKIIERVIERRKKEQQGQFDLFSSPEETGSPQEKKDIPIPEIEYNKKEKLVLEKEMLGLYVSDHPLFGVESQLRRQVDVQLTELSGMDDGQICIVGGLISGLQKKWTRKGDLMAIFSLEDILESVEVLVFPRTMEAIGGILNNDDIIVIKGRVDNKDSRPKIIAMEARKFEGINRADTPLRLNPESNFLRPENLELLKNLLLEHPGSSEVFVNLGNSKIIKLPAEYNVNIETGLIAKLKVMLGEEAVIL